jgi:hypothetical protein
VDQPTAIILAAVVGFVGGLVAALCAFVVARATYQQKSDELFFKALDFLGGGSQKRNLGIAAIELYWSSNRHRPASVSLLIGSAIYLLLVSDQKEASHELHNLDRIMTLLLRRESKSLEWRSQYERLLEALRAARSGHRNAGLSVPDSQLGRWEKEVELFMTWAAQEAVV